MQDVWLGGMVSTVTYTYTTGVNPLWGQSLPPFCACLSVKPPHRGLPMELLSVKPTHRGLPMELSFG